MKIFKEAGMEIQKHPLMALLTGSRRQKQNILMMDDASVVVYHTVQILEAINHSTIQTVNLTDNNHVAHCIIIIAFYFILFF